VVAVSTLVSEHGTFRRSTLVGTFWGLGHALALLAAGGAVLALKLTVSPELGRWLEGGVAVMLVLLGVRALRQALLGRRLHAHRHRHDDREHLHLHVHRTEEMRGHDHQHGFAFGWRPFLVGIVHGLAGSAGLTLLVLATAPSALAGLAYVAMLGFGSVAGMLALTGLLSLPLALFTRRYARLHFHFQFLAGAASVAFGLWLLGLEVMAENLP
jgi:ABC-type nickel/cobalt efflux system permease component RcnA